MAASPWLRRLGLAAPPIVYAAGLFWLSHQPVLPAPPGNDKLMHVVAYVPLGFLVARWFRAEAWARGGFAWAVASAYGLSDEIHQSFVPGRHASGADVVADAVGAAIGAAVFVVAVRAWRRRQRRLL